MIKSMEKYVDPNIFEALHDLEVTMNCRIDRQELAGLVSRITDPNCKLPCDLIADCLEQIASLYRQLYEERKLARFRLENQEPENQ